MFRLLRLSAAVILILGCGSRSDSTIDAGTTGDADQCDPAQRFECCNAGCGSDTSALADCVSGAWACTEGVPKSSCPASSFCVAGLPPPASSLKLCVDVDAGVCLNACDPGEECFTQLACGPTQDGGSQCSWGGGADAGGDNRCHRSCEVSRCPSYEQCTVVPFFGCGDYNGSPNGGRKVCCPSSGCP